MRVSIVRKMPTDTRDTLIVEREDGIVTVTMNRPHRKNAASETMWSELLQVFREINNSVRDRVLVLTGAGGDFCSGADVGGMDERANTAEPASDDPPRHQLASMRNITDICLTLNRLPQPTIAKVLKQKGYDTSCFGKWHLGFGATANDWKEPLDAVLYRLGLMFVYKVSKEHWKRAINIFNQIEERAKKLLEQDL